MCSWRRYADDMLMLCIVNSLLGEHRKTVLVAVPPQAITIVSVLGVSDDDMNDVMRDEK
jgi:hypothetical protein